MSTLLQPPPIQSTSRLPWLQWLQDTWNKLKNLQSQSGGGGVYITGLTLQNNTPTGGNIAWSAFTLWYNNTPYAISAGNTSAGEFLAWWVVGASSLSIGNSFTPSPTIFEIFTNTQGTADTTYQKVGANSVQDNQVLGGFQVGYAPQNPSDVSILGSATTATLLSYTGAGGVVSVGITDQSGGSTCPTAPGVTLNITFDGGSTQTYSLKPNNPVSSPWSAESLNCAVDSVGSGSSANDRLVIPFSTAFKSSCLITLSMPGGLIGQFFCTVSWAKKL